MLTGTIQVERTGYTNNGNPSYRVQFKPDGADRIVTGRTKPNGDGFANMPREGRATVSYHETASGRIMFTYIGPEV